MIRYCDVPLLDVAPEVLAEIEPLLRPETLAAWAVRSWPAPPGALSSVAFGGHLRALPPRVGVLSWPAGAARFAAGHYLTDEEGLGQIRQYVHAGYSLSTAGSASGAGYRAGPFVLDDGQRKVETDLWLLPARPVCRVRKGTPGLYLLTLVDDRFFWWSRDTTSLADAGDDSTWPGLYTVLGQALGLTAEQGIFHDEVHADYLQPAPWLRLRYRPLPLLLDAVAHAVGQCIVRRLDGTVHALSASGSLETLAANLARESQESGNGRILGHDLDLHPGAFEDLPGLVPEQVTVVLGDAAGESLHARTISLASLELTEYAQASGHAGNRVLWWPAPADGTDAAGDDFCRRAATDWYLWRLGRAFAVHEGALAWEMEGHTDLVEWAHTADRITTLALRGPWLDARHEPWTAGAGDGTFLALLYAKDYSAGAEYGPAYRYLRVRATSDEPPIQYAFVESEASDRIAYHERAPGAGDLPVWAPTVYTATAPGTLASDGAAGAVAWTDPANAGAADDTYATCELPAGQQSHYLTATNLGLAVGASARIVSVLVEVEAYADGASVADVEVKLIVDGAITGTSRHTGNDLPTSDDDTYRAYGPSTPSVWGVNLTPAQANAATFGVAVRYHNTSGSTRTVSVDHLRITVSAVNLIEPLSVVRIRPGSDFDLIDGGQEAWTDLVRLTNDADADGTVGYHRYWDQDPDAPAWTDGREVRVVLAE